MTYASTLDTKGRIGTVTAVAAIQLAVGYALVTGLAAKFLPRPAPPPLVATDVPPPKPVEDHPRRDPARHTNPVSHDSHQVLPNDTPTFTPVIDPIGDGELGGSGHDIGEVHIPQADPPPLPTLIHGARPRGNPGLWVTPNDYPAADLRLEHTGVTKFRLGIGSDGRVENCTITTSSGYPGLDLAACAKLTARGRFDPALDSTGARLAGSYSSSVRWQIPE